MLADDELHRHAVENFAQAVTFLFADSEASTRFLRRLRGNAVQEQHKGILRGAIGRGRGDPKG